MNYTFLSCQLLLPLNTSEHQLYLLFTLVGNVDVKDPRCICTVVHILHHDDLTLSTLRLFGLKKSQR